MLICKYDRKVRNVPGCEIASEREVNVIYEKNAI